MSVSVFFSKLRRFGSVVSFLVFLHRMNREEGRVDVSRSSKQRALGDLTNIAGNRGVSKLTGKFIIGNRIRKSIENFETEASRSSKRVCKGSEDLFIAKENTSVIKNFTNLDSISSSSMSTEDWHMKCLSDPKRKPILPVSTDNEEPKKTKLLSNSLNPGLHFITGTSSSRGYTQEGTCVRDSYISGIKKPCHSEKGKNICSTPDGNIGMDERNTIHNANVMQNVADVDCGQRPLTVGLNRCSGQDCSCLLCTKGFHFFLVFFSRHNYEMNAYMVLTQTV